MIVLIDRILKQLLEKLNEERTWKLIMICDGPELQTKFQRKFRKFKLCQQ